MLFINDLGELILCRCLFMKNLKVLNKNSRIILHSLLMKKKSHILSLIIDPAIIAEKLLRSWNKARDIVGVHMNRGIWFVIATLLGVMKSGGCYLPLDPYYPNERLSYMVEHPETALIITDDGDQLDWLHGTQIILNINELDMQQTANPALPHINDDDLCYVMYTSDSTGKPKGVMISHRTVAHYLGWMQSRFTLTTDKRVLNQTTYSFDISAWEIFGPYLWCWLRTH